MYMYQITIKLCILHKCHLPLVVAAPVYMYVIWRV